MGIRTPGFWSCEEPGLVVRTRTGKVQTCRAPIPGPILMIRGDWQLESWVLPCAWEGRIAQCGEQGLFYSQVCIQLSMQLDGP